VPTGQRIVRAQPRAGLALPSTARAGQPEPAYDAAPAYVQDKPGLDAASLRRAQHACEAYQAAELIQPRPGLIIRIQA
jgi:hypothetical protein